MKNQLWDTHKKILPVMGQGIFKAIFGHFHNTFDTQMKIWTLKNILSANIAQM